MLVSLRGCSRSFVDRFNPGTRGGADVTRAEPEALTVRFDDEVASAPVICDLRPIGLRPEEPGLVAEAVDLPVLRDASKSLGLATGVGVERRHQLVGRSGARKDLGIEVGELVGVLPRGRRSSDGDEARRLPR